MASPALVCNNTETLHSESNSPPNTSPSFVIRQGGSPPSSNEQFSSTSRLGCLKRSIQTMQLSEEAEDLIYNSWGRGTKAPYNSAWKKWGSWCDRRGNDPFSAPIAQVLECFTYLFYEGFQYRTINVHRSAISSVLPYVNNQTIGQHHLVKMLMKGILRGNPTLPRYEDTWNIDILLRFLLSLPDNKDLSLKLLSKKLATLLAIAAPKTEIARLDRKFMRVTQQGITFYLPGFSKTQKYCKSREVFYAKHEENQKLSVIDCLTEYFERTKAFRNPNHSNDPLLRTIIDLTRV